MAKITVYNPPPTWPDAPAGWKPPPGWQPDPAWGPPPPGWPLWVTEQANPRSWGYTSASAGGLFVVFLVVALVASGGRLGAEGGGEIFGRFLVAGAVAGLITRAVRGRLPVWVYPLIVLGVALVLSAVTVAGRASGS